ncbi:Cation dependent mannose-6-phosphate cargo receptor [Schizosaccharomyces pombe]
MRLLTCLINVLAGLTLFSQFQRAFGLTITRRGFKVQESDEEPFCALHHPNTGEYFDLSGLIRDNTSEKGDYSVNGYDFGTNFSINLCHPVVSNLTNYTVEGDVSSEDSIGGFFTVEDDDLYSIGQAAYKPYFRGKKLIMQLDNGSLCPKSNHIRMSTLISFTCNRDPYTAPSVITYVGNLNDCAFFFEWKTIHACPTVKKDSTLNPVSVFLLFCAIAFLAYFVGGFVYQRVVLNARGLRQIPNYEMWRSLFGFISDILIILYSSILSILPSSITRMRGNRRNIDYVEDALIDDIDT